jgi:hypothetical protein
MKIKFTDSVAGANFAYRKNQVVDLRIDLARGFVKAGQAVEFVDADQVEAAVSVAPETASRRPRRRVLGGLLNG